jgi:hypothetical protein
MAADGWFQRRDAILCFCALAYAEGIPLGLLLLLETGNKSTTLLSWLYLTPFDSVVHCDYVAQVYGQNYDILKNLLLHTYINIHASDN